MTDKINPSGSPQADGQHQTDFAEWTNASPRTAGYEWLDELPPKDMVFCESLYLWATYATLDEEDNLAEDLREAARRIGGLILARSIEEPPK